MPAAQALRAAGLKRIVPFGKDAYGEQLDRSKWGLIEVARMEVYKSTVWATWDRSAPSFLEITSSTT